MLTSRSCAKVQATLCRRPLNLQRATAHNEVKHTSIDSASGFHTCKLGAEEERRPVAVAHWFQLQRTRPSPPLRSASTAAACSNYGA